MKITNMIECPIPTPSKINEMILLVRTESDIKVKFYVSDSLKLPLAIYKHQVQNIINTIGNFSAIEKYFFVFRNAYLDEKILIIVNPHIPPIIIL